MLKFGTKEKNSFNIKDMLTPPVIASVLALIVYFTHITLPELITSSITTVGDLTSPLAMIIIGSSLANIPLKEVFTEIRIYPYTVLKQIILPIAIYPLLAIFIKDPLILGVTLIMIAMPVGNSAVLFTTEYGGNISLAAKSVFMTTLSSVLTIPLIVWMFLI